MPRMTDADTGYRVALGDSPRRIVLPRFPNPVDEVSARLVAAGVVLIAALFLLTCWTWLLALLAYGFVARAAAGPTFSPLGQLVTRVLRPRLRLAPRYVAGPPKRFAQAIGATLSCAALALQVLGQHEVATALIGVLAVFALLESALAFCAGCRIFALLIRAGLVPAAVCAECANIGLRRTA